MEKHIVLALLIILMGGIIPSVTAMDNPITATYWVENMSVETGAHIGENSEIGVNVLGDGGVGSTFIVQVENQKVGVDLYNKTDDFRIESEDIIFVYGDEDLAVSIKNRTVDFGDGPLKVEDVYNLSEEQEEIYSPGDDMKNETIINSTELERKIIEEK